MMTNNTLSWNEYLALFEDILNGKIQDKPYDNADFLNYTKLNKSRQERWLKKGVLNEDLVEAIKNIETKQTWYAITEPWCGDAAHNLPFFQLLAELNENVELKVVLRDTAPFMIDDYLTNGGKSVPIVVIRDQEEKDLFVWGPRPKEAQQLFLEMKANNTPYEEQKIALQQWYNKNKGENLQSELMKFYQLINA